MTTRREEDLAFLKEVLGYPISKILYNHENVYCGIEIEEMNTRLSIQGREVFIREIQRIRDVAEVLIDYELFDICLQVLKTLDIKLANICTEDTGKDCCVELNSTRQWMSSFLICLGILINSFNS